MKKVVIAICVILAISASFVAGVWFGVNKFEPLINTPTIESGELSGDESLSGDVVEQEPTLTEEELVAKYKISGDYVLGDLKDSYDETFWNIVNHKGVQKSSLEFESDGVNHKVELEHQRTVEGGNLTYSIYKFKLDGVVPQDDEISLINDSYDYVTLFDVDENDGCKELILQKNTGLWVDVFVYQAKNDGLKLIGNFGESILKVNDRYIIPKYNYDFSEYFVEGYYLYEDGEIKFIDRLLTGEKITDEEGNYTENFRKLVFTAPGGDSSIHCYAKYNGEIVRVAGEVKLIKKVNYKTDAGMNSEYYHLEAASELELYAGESKVKIPAGTILAE